MLSFGATHKLQFDVSLQRHEGRWILLSDGNYQSPRGTDKAPDFSPSVFQRLLRANERSCTVNLSIVMDNGYLCSHNARHQRRSECPVPAGYHRLLQKVEPMAYGGNRIETVCVSVSIITTFVLSLGMPASTTSPCMTLHSTPGISNGVYIDWQIDDESKKGFSWY